MMLLTALLLVSVLLSLRAGSYNTPTAELIKGIFGKSADKKVNLVICTEPDAAWTRQGDDFNIADIDATIVTSHMILAATEKDVASLWICRFWPEIARKEFHIPDNYRPVNILALGYTDDAWKSPAPSNSSINPSAEL